MTTKKNNLWDTTGHENLSTHLMKHHGQSPNNKYIESIMNNMNLASRKGNAFHNCFENDDASLFHNCYANVDQHCYIYKIVMESFGMISIISNHQNKYELPW